MKDELFSSFMRRYLDNVVRTKGHLYNGHRTNGHSCE